MEIEINGIRMHYEEAGVGPAVVLIHAFPLAGTMWRQQVAALAPHFRVIVPDLRGFGASDAPPGPYLMDTQADDLAALLTHLGLSRAAIVGLSMGGYIAFALWRRHHAALAALVLADTRAGADSEAGRATRETNAQLVEAEGVVALADKLIPGLVAPGASTTLREELQALICANRPHAIAGALRGMALRPDVTADLARINVPTLVIVGTEDALTPPPEAEAIQRRVHGSTLVLIEHAGHLSNLEQPETFNQALLNFLGPALGVQT